MTDFFWSDQHFGHKKLYDAPFMSAQDPEKKMRDFDSLEDCEAYMIDQYNKVVKQDDRVYFLGDVVMSKKSLPLLNKMKKGNKHLILGNHDNQCDVKLYREYFKRVLGCQYLDKYKSVLSHFPVYPGMLRRSKWGPPRFLWNLHGHTHDSYVSILDLEGNEIRDEKYINLSVEAIGFRPISAEELGIDCHDI